MAKKQTRREMASPGPTDSLRLFLNEQWESFNQLVDRYQWPIETARWHELVFCLLLRLGQPGIKADKVRHITQILADIDLLDMDKLTNMLDDKGRLDFTDPEAGLVVSLLKKTGLSPVQAEVALVTICEAAAALSRKHGGKIQRYLRLYGQQMLNDLETQFSFSQMRSEDIKPAFTHWLQNVLNMPLELWDAETRQICRQFRVSRDELIALVDEMDINLALLDDVLAGYVAPYGSAERKNNKTRIKLPAKGKQGRNKAGI